MRMVSKTLILELITILCIGLLYCCDAQSGKQNKATKTQAIQQKNKGVLEIQKDSILYVDSTKILGQSYFAYYLSNDKFFILSQDKDTLFVDHDLCPQFDFEDFNEDGYKDIRFHYNSNVPAVQDLVLFDPLKKVFRKVENFGDYPDPIKLGKTKYYYSYHRNGCADLNWDSDLFYIDNFKTIRIGNIAGRQCENSGIKDGIYVNKVKGKKEILYKTLPIETIGKFEDYKWGFIKDYWFKNYTKFIR